MKVAAAQLPASKLTDPAAALANIHRAIDQAAEQGAELLVLPECAYPAYYLGSVEAYHAATVVDNATFIADLSERARRHAMHVVCGFVEKRGETLANAAVAIDDRGKVLGIYRKTFLWGDDNGVFAPGEEVAPLRTRWGNIGIVICADARAPETIAALAAQQAELVCVPTCWVNVAQSPGEFYNPQPDFLIEARAREFALPFVCANKFARETPQLDYCGYSLITDHTGRVLAKASPDRPEILCVEVGFNKPNVTNLADEIRDRLETDAPPEQPEIGKLSEITVSAVPASCLLPLADDEEGHDLLQSLAAGGTNVVATTLPDEGTNESFVVYARSLGLRLIGWAVRDRVVSEVFGSYAGIPGDRIGSYGVARARALDGAAILFVTDMPEDMAILRTRAAENRVYIVASGESTAAIIGPGGEVLAACHPTDPKPVTEMIDLRLAADKLVFPGTDIWAQRRVQACRAAFGKRPANPN
ncbi:MAG: hypothetical protein KAV82_03935 [Phycisphaerae bacterium]|nr:hypothetical protein [Phycisphaerae bacterium]